MVEESQQEKIRYDEDMRKIWQGFLVLVGLALLADLVFVNWKLSGRQQPVTVIREEGGEVDLCDRACVEQIIESKLAEGEVSQLGSKQTESESGCDRACVEEVIRELVPGMIEEGQTPAPTPTPTPTAVPTATPTKAETRTETVDLSGGSASGGDWVRIGNSEKWLDTSLYGELVEVTWQGWLKVKDGNGIAYARLYDATNNRAVDGSQVSNSSGEKASFYSGSLSIWRGQNQYYIEVKSSTGYEVTVEGPKLKLEVR